MRPWKGHNTKLGSRRLLLAVAGMTVVWLIGVALAASGTISAGSSIASFSPSNEKTAPGPGSAVPVGHGFALAAGQAAPGRGQAAQGRGQAAPARGQAPTEGGSVAANVMSQDAFKNVTAIINVPVDEFMQTMGIFSAALSMCCAECHTGAGTDTVKWELDTPTKRTARRMVGMMAAINRDNFNGRQVVTCWTCHRGRDRPVQTPTLDTVYGTPTLEPDDVLTRAPGGATPDQVLDNYLKAVGGAAAANRLTSYVAKGNSVGFGRFAGRRPVEIYAKAPDQRATFNHTADGDVARTFDGKTGWISTPLTAVKEFELATGELDGAKFDAQIAFPGQVKRLLTNMRVSFPSTINDREVEVLQGNGPRNLLVTLYFDKQSGLLTRMVRHTTSPVGRAPTQVDFADYRDVAGVKLPYKFIFAWLDGQDTFELTEIQPNVAVDAAKFAKPPLPTPAK
jgi:photosynthetic reaction center cytochrome c subunit